MLDKIMQSIVNDYYEDNAKKLHNMVDKILLKLRFTGLVDNEDFYSLANEIFVDVIKKYDKSQPFDGFLYACLTNKIKTEMTKRNRYKRKSDAYAISIDTPIGDNNLTIEDTLQSDFNIENKLQDLRDVYSKKVDGYLTELSDIQKDIAKYIMQGKDKDSIMNILNLSDKQYKMHWKNMTSYEKKRLLDYNEEECKMKETLVEAENVTETYRNTSYSIYAISKKLRNRQIKDNHILQRHSGQWARFAKSELISDILRGKSLTQIIISEEIKNGVRMQWLIDGKQRCTTLDDYLHDGFSISKNVKNYNIKYQIPKLDENGNEVLNEEGFPEVEVKEFDIRGKKFSKLPEELQDIFKDRQIPVLYNMNCTKKDIAEDIARFNRSRPMNKAQNGWLGIDESFGEMVDNIAKMDFFQKAFSGSNYTDNTHTSGAIRRAIVEGIMVSDFIDEFGDFEKMCEFLSEEAGDSNFTDFYCMVDRLTKICTKEISSLFNSKNSFLWFGLFARFIKICDDDNCFTDFLLEFKNSLHSKEINGISFDDLNKGSTKDKNKVIAEMNHLEILMYEFLGINKDKNSEPCDCLAFVRDNVDQTVTQEDISLYEDCIDDITLNVDNNTHLLDKQNRMSLVAMMAYACLTDKDELMEDWVKTYFRRYNTYFRNQQQNYLTMKQDFDRYCQIKQKTA